MTDVSNPHDYDNHKCYNSYLCRTSIPSLFCPLVFLKFTVCWIKWQKTIRASHRLDFVFMLTSIWCGNVSIYLSRIQSSDFVKCQILVNLTIILSYWHILQAATTDHLVFLKKASLYSYNDNAYNIQSAVDPRYPKMEPILCFLPDQVVAPEYQLPQLFDTTVRGSQVFRHHHVIVFSLYSFTWFFALSYLDLSGQMWWYCFLF